MNYAQNLPYGIRTLFALFIGITLTLVGLSTGVWANSCSQVFDGIKILSGTPTDPIVAWRSTSTQTLPAGEIAPTSADREKAIQTAVIPLENEILGIGLPHDTPPMEFFAQAGAKTTFLHKSNGIDGTPTRIHLSGVGKSGLLKGTLLLPVSGHTKVEDAKIWAKTDTYTVSRDISEDPQGNVFPSENSYSNDRPSLGKQIVLVKDVKSLDLVTKQEIAVQLQKDRMIRFVYYRSGSGGPGGYFEGRVLELTWDGT